MAYMRLTGYSTNKEHKSTLIDIQEMGNILGRIKDISIELVLVVPDCSKRSGCILFS